MKPYHNPFKTSSDFIQIGFNNVQLIFKNCSKEVKRKFLEKQKTYFYPALL